MLALGMFAVVAPTGCTQSGYPKDPTFQVTGRAPSPAPTPTKFTYQYPPDAPTVSVSDLQAFAARYKGRVVLLDFWASWSRRCREELPELARLQDELRDDGFQVISCNIESPERWSDHTVPILHGADANFPCVVVPPEAKTPLRAWLALDWSYDLPARFLLDRSGSVVERMLSETPVAEVEFRARRRLGDPTRTVSIAGHEAASSAAVPPVRAKLINLHTGAWESIRAADAAGDDDGMRAERIAADITHRMDRTRNPRIAILPFADSATRTDPDESAMTFGRAVEDALRRAGYYDLISPVRAQRMIEDLGVSALAIDFDPRVIRGHVNADYLVLGWRTAETESQPTRTDIASRQDDEAP